MSAAAICANFKVQHQGGLLHTLSAQGHCSSCAACSMLQYVAVCCTKLCEPVILMQLCWVLLLYAQG
jgi:hypothetical protein